MELAPYTLCSSSDAQAPADDVALQSGAKLASQLRRALPEQQKDWRVWSAQDAVLKHREAVRVLLAAKLPHNLVLLPATCTSLSLQHTPPK